jgi:hypothetical protein
MVDVPLTLSSLTVPVLQLPASNSNSSQELNRSSLLTNSITHQLTHSTTLTPRLAAISHQPPTLLTASSWPSLCGLDMDCVENTASNNSSSIVVCISVAAIVKQQPLFTEPLPSSGCFIAAYFAVDACQWVYMPHYLHCHCCENLKSHWRIIV